MTGNNVGQALSGSRNLFALAEQGDLPALARIHPVYRTPWVAIVFTSAVSLALALTGCSRCWPPAAPSRASSSTRERARR